MIFVPNVLVTDDDSAFRRVMSDALSRRGFCVTEARDGQEAIDVISCGQVHVALVDIHMPRVTGLDVMRHLVERPGSPPCVLMSAALDEQIRAEAERMKAYQVLSKPIRLTELSDVICGALVDVYGWQRK